MIVNEFSLDYEIFEESLIYQESNLMSYLSECVALESGDIEHLRGISEGAIDSIKEFFHNLIEKIKNVVKKFVTRVSQMLMTNNAFLEKYKKTILGNEFKDRELTMYRYDVNKLENGFQIPSNFNFNEFKEMSISDEDFEKQFIKKYLKDLKADSDDSIKEQITTAICGEEEVTMKMRELNRTNMFNFCANYEKNIKAIEDAQSDVDKSFSRLQTELERYTNQIKLDARSKEEAKKPEETENKEKEQQTTGSNSASTTNTSSSSTSTVNTDDDDEHLDKYNLNASAIISNVYGTILSEKVKMGKVQGDVQSSASASVNTGSNGEHITSDQAKAGVKDMVTQDSTNDEKLKELEKLKTGAQNYATILTTILTTRMNLVVQVYKDYIKILRQHVKDYGGDPDSVTAKK